MAATLPFEDDIPDAGVAAQFTAGEMALGVTSGLGGVSAGTYYLARRFVLQAGAYVLRFYAKDAGSAWVGLDGISLGRVAVCAPGASQPSEVEFWAPDGESRIDLVLTKITSGQAYVAMTLLRNSEVIYASSADGWRFDTAIVADSDLPSTGDARLELPVFTLSPNWGEGVMERLSWATGRAGSETDTEQRRSLRRHPRRYFEASFLRDGVGAQRLKNFLLGIGKRHFLAPLWHDQQRLSTALSPLLDTIEFPADTLQWREWYEGDLVLLMRDDPDDYELVEVLERDTGIDTITVAAPTRTWPAGTWARPLRKMWMPQSPTLSLPTSRVSQVTMGFELVDTERNIAADWGYGAPLWRFEPNWADSISLDFALNTYDLDYAPSPVQVTHPGGQIRVIQRAALLLQGRQEVSTFRSFLAAARGSAVRFYMPSFTHDVTPSADPAGSVFYAAPAGLSEYFNQPQQSVVVLAMCYRDGRPAQYRTVTSVVRDGDHELITLDVAIASLSRHELSRVQLIVPSRFEQDAFELHHQTDACRAVATSVVTRSSLIDGLTTLTNWLPRSLLPAVEAIVAGAAVTGGALRLGLIPWQYESLTVSAALRGGSFPLTVIYSTYDQGVEAIVTDAAVTGGAFESDWAVWPVDDVSNCPACSTPSTPTLWVTSRPYPVVASDNIVASARIVGGEYRIPPLVLELITAASVTGGSFPLTVIYSTYDQGVEAVVADAAVTGGSFPLTVIYSTYDQGIEAIVADAAVTGGQLVLALIPYTIETEALTPTVSLTGGTLS